MDARRSRRRAAPVRCHAVIAAWCPIRSTRTAGRNHADRRPL